MSKTIGLLGGTSYPSTMYYYRRLNEMYQEALGGFHSCPLVIHNIDYHEIKSRYHHDWDTIPQILKRELQALLAYNPDCLLICNNTLHKAYDLIKEELDIQIPVGHIIELTKDHLIEQSFGKVLLLGTQFTMEDDFFKGPLTDAGISVEIPSFEERAQIQAIQSAVAKGEMSNEFVDYFRDLTESNKHCDAIILGCTEFPLIFAQMKSPIKLINTIELQCEFAMDFMLH